MKDFPVEILETKAPLRVRRYAIRPDSGGAGQWRGGNGVVREFELLCDEAASTSGGSARRRRRGGSSAGAPAHRPRS